MSNRTDRISGLLFVAVGLFVYLVLIPWQVETVEYGAMRPKTLPQIFAVIVAVTGLAMALRPPEVSPAQNIPWLRSAMFAGVLIAGLAVMSRAGFIYTATPLALVLMLLIGERRPLWLIAGAAGTPALIWFCVVYLLERPLP